MDALDAWPRPDGWHTVTPRIITEDPEGLVEFCRDVFGAEGEVVEGRPVELRMGDSLVMISDGGGVRPPTPAMLYVYVADTDDVYRRATERGAVSVEEPLETSYGDRRAAVSDDWGNLWQIATAAR